MQFKKKRIKDEGIQMGQEKLKCENETHTCTCTHTHWTKIKCCGGRSEQKKMLSEIEPKADRKKKSWLEMDAEGMSLF